MLRQLHQKLWQTLKCPAIFQQELLDQYDLNEGKYDLSLHTWREPIIRVTAEAKRRDINIGTPMIGQTFDLMNLPNNEWWMD